MVSHADDCIILLKYLEVSGQQSLRKMEKDVGIPFSTIREYINPKVMARRSWDSIMQLRNNNGAYAHYMSTIEKSDSSGCSINISKFNYLQHYGMHYGYYVYYSEEKNKVFVEKIDVHDVHFFDLIGK